ncbi:hypothetical protein FN846DRAFT_986805, partial [Sphaerosporella brunnea]
NIRSAGCFQHAAVSTGNRACVRSLVFTLALELKEKGSIEIRTEGVVRFLGRSPCRRSVVASPGCVGQRTRIQGDLWRRQHSVRGSSFSEGMAVCTGNRACVRSLFFKLACEHKVYCPISCTSALLLAVSIGTWLGFGSVCTDNRRSPHAPSNIHDAH